MSFSTNPFSFNSTSSDPSMDLLRSLGAGGSLRAALGPGGPSSDDIMAEFARLMGGGGASSSAASARTSGSIPRSISARKNTLAVLQAMPNAHKMVLDEDEEDEAVEDEADDPTPVATVAMESASVAVESASVASSTVSSTPSGLVSTTSTAAPSAVVGTASQAPGFFGSMFGCSRVHSAVAVAQVPTPAPKSNA